MPTHLPHQNPPPPFPSPVVPPEQDINSPFRHVRTRIYFTSESHMHSLLNVLRFCQLGELRGPLHVPGLACQAVGPAVDVLGAQHQRRQRRRYFPVSHPAPC